MRGDAVTAENLPSFSSSPGCEDLGPLLPSSLRREAGKIVVDVHGSTERTTQCQSWEEEALGGNTPKFMTNPSLPTLRLCKTEKFPSGSFISPESGGAHTQLLPHHLSELVTCFGKLSLGSILCPAVTFPCPHSSLLWSPAPLLAQGEGGVILRSLWSWGCREFHEGDELLPIIPKIRSFPRLGEWRGGDSHPSLPQPPATKCNLSRGGSGIWEWQGASPAQPSPGKVTPSQCQM